MSPPYPGPAVKSTDLVEKGLPVGRVSDDVLALDEVLRVGHHQGVPPLVTHVEVEVVNDGGPLLVRLETVLGGDR